MKRQLSVIVCGLKIIGISLYAQGSYPSAAGPRRPLSPPGNITVSLHSSEMVVSLDQLIRMSPLIIEGTVSAVLPSIQSASDIPTAIETHSVITVGQVLRGKIDGSTQITLVQNGGSGGGRQVSISDDPLVRAGEHHFLFLAEDTRTEVPNVDRLPRYFAIGFWSGKVIIDTLGHVAFNRRSILEIKELTRYDGGNAGTFSSAVKDRIKVLFAKAPPYPLGVKSTPSPNGTILPIEK